MIVTDSRDHGGAGIWVLQDHQGSAKAGDLEGRYMLVAERKIGRDTDPANLGTLIHERGSIGDVIGGMLWKETTRFAPAWAFVFPSRTTGATTGETKTFAGGIRPGSEDGPGAVGASGPKGGEEVKGVDPDGPGGRIDAETGIAGAAITGPNAGSNVHQATFNLGAKGSGSIQVGGATIKTPGSPGGPIGTFPGRLTFGILKVLDRLIQPAMGAALSVSPSNVAAWVGSRELEVKPSTILPTRNRTWDEDNRFRPITPFAPKLWPQHPSGWHGLTLPGVNEGEQIEYFLPVEPRIPLVHANGEPACGAVVCDLNASNTPDPDRHARLHSMCRIVKSTKGRANSVAWNLTFNGQGDGRGGMVFDISRRKKKTGPVTGERDRRQSRRKAAESAVFRGSAAAVLGGASGAAGLKVQALTAWANEPGLKPGSAAAFLSGGSLQSGSGSAIALASYNDGGCLHPGFLNDIHQITTDGDGNPVNPLHLSVRSILIDPSRPDYDGPWEYDVTAYQGSELAFPLRVHFGWKIGSKAFGWSTWSAEEEQPPLQNLPPVSGTPRPREPEPNPRKQFDASPISPRYFTQRWAEMAVASLSFRAQRWGVGLPQNVHEKFDPDSALEPSRGPIVLRGETFAKQPSGLGGVISYTAEDRAGGPYTQGSAIGGYWLMPPEVTGEDYASDFAPAGRTISGSTFGLIDSVKLGFGFPHIETGGVRNGWSIASESAELRFRNHVTDGTGSEFFRLTNDGAIWVKELAGDPAAPDSGFVALYAKAGDLFQRDSAGLVTSLV